MLAGTEESPGETFLLEGRRFKMVRGMGSLSAMQDGSADRYFQEGELSSEEARAGGNRGPRAVSGTRSPTCCSRWSADCAAAWATSAARRSTSCERETEFVRITTAGLRESHPHDVTITREAPNYSRVEWRDEGLASESCQETDRLP